MVTSAASAAALVVREVLDHREGGERDNDAADEYVRDLLPLGRLLCGDKRFRWGMGARGMEREEAGMSRTNRLLNRVPRHGPQARRRAY